MSKSNCVDAVDEFLSSSLHVARSLPNKVGRLQPIFLPLPNALAPEFTQICKAVAIGFGVMGFIGYFVKLIHIPM
jgi:hypothetical protein